MNTEISGPWNHETEPHCCGCWIIRADTNGPYALCNECGFRIDILPLLAAARSALAEKDIALLAHDEWEKLAADLLQRADAAEGGLMEAKAAIRWFVSEEWPQDWRWPEEHVSIIRAAIAGGK